MLFLFKITVPLCTLCIRVDHWVIKRPFRIDELNRAAAVNSFKIAIECDKFRQEKVTFLFHLMYSAVRENFMLILHPLSFCSMKIATHEYAESMSKADEISYFAGN